MSYSPFLRHHNKYCHHDQADVVGKTCSATTLATGGGDLQQTIAQSRYRHKKKKGISATRAEARATELMVQALRQDMRDNALSLQMFAKYSQFACVTLRTLWRDLVPNWILPL